MFSDFEFLAGQLWPLAGAVAAELVVRSVAARRAWLVPLVAGIAIPALVWPSHLFGIALTARVAWTIELWGGTVVLCSLAGALLGGLLLRPAPALSG